MAVSGASVGGANLSDSLGAGAGAGGVQYPNGNIRGLSYASNSISIGTTAPQALYLKSDGLELYVLGNSTDVVEQWTMTVAWDLTTATQTDTFSVTTQEATPEGMFFKSDGTEFYVVGSTADAVFQYDLSTAWDLTTASYSGTSFSVATQETAGSGVAFNTDGTKMFVSGRAGDDVNEYTLSTAWDISSAVFVDSFVAGIGDIQDAAFNEDGTVMLLTQSGTDQVFQYVLSTGFDVSTSAFDQMILNTEAQASSPTACFFGRSFQSLFVCDQVNDDVFRYDVIGTEPE
jgi:DNA-binding beta-propeller fold protein YncE